MRGGAENPLAVALLSEGAHSKPTAHPVTSETEPTTDKAVHPARRRAPNTHGISGLKCIYNLISIFFLTGVSTCHLYQSNHVFVLF